MPLYHLEFLAGRRYNVCGDLHWKERLAVSVYSHRMRHNSVAGLLLRIFNLRCALVVWLVLGVVAMASAEKAEGVFSCSLELAEESPWPASAGYVEVCPPADFGADSLAAMVFTPSWAGVKSKVLWQARGERLKILFDTSSGEKSYELKLELRKQGKASDWTPKAGLFLETRKRVDGKVDTLAESQELWRKATVQGVAPMRRIFDGVNPLGPINNCIYRYTGSFSVDTPGEYQFFTASDDASFLLVDNVCVAQAPGWHGVGDGLRGEHGGKATLTKGVHGIEYLNVQNEGGPFYAIAAWRPPGAPVPVVMPESAFVPLANFKVKNVRFPKDGATQPRAAVSWRITGHSMIDGLAMVNVEFAASSNRSDCVYQWRFDDGVEASGKVVEHVFFSTGLREVRLELVKEGKVLHSERCELLVHPLWGQVDDWRKEIAQKQFKVAKSANLKTIPVNDLANLVRIVLKLQNHKQVEWLTPVCVERARELAAAHGEAFVALARELVGPRSRDYGAAERLLRAVVESPAKDEGMRERARLWLVDLLLRWKADAAAAAAVLDGFMKDKVGGDERRFAIVLSGDVTALSGDGQAALKRYGEAEPRGDAKESVRRMRSDAKRCAAAQYVMLKEYEEAERLLDAIEWETPPERMSPELNLLWARLLLARKEYDLVRYRCLLVQRHATPGSETAADALLLRAKAHLGKGEKDTARECLGRLKAEHPYSAAAAEARDL